MLIAPTIDRLNALALGGMARALADQQGHPDYAALTFEERLGLLVDREMQDRENGRLARHLKAAKLRDLPPAQPRPAVHRDRCRIGVHLGGAACHPRNPRPGTPAASPGGWPVTSPVAAGAWNG